MIFLTDQPIDIAAVLQSASSLEAGAAVLFLGTVRQRSSGKTVAALQYECYPEMAESILRQLADQARSRWNLQGCGVVHRIGRVQVGEISVAVACSAEHRAAAFQAAQWLIDQIKQQAPIWKKEFFTDGECQWVSDRPSSPCPSPGAGDAG